MRSAPDRRERKGWTHNELSFDAIKIPAAERVRRINTLIRARVYDVNVIKKLPSVVQVPMRQTITDPNTGIDSVQTVITPVSRETLLSWLNELTAPERQRLYVLGREKIDFKFRESEYPDLLPTEEDSDRERSIKARKMAEMRIFQKEQKRLADALEVVAIPMLEGIFKRLGKNVHVYLESKNDDIAGGLDVAVDFLHKYGTPKTFHDGTPMRLSIDMTYARMKGKIMKDLDRHKICEAAVEELRDEQGEIPNALSNARAMKWFRTLVELLSSNMSTKTFDANAPLPSPQEHIARLILCLDWDNAFNATSHYVADEAFVDTFASDPLAYRIAKSIDTQLVGLLNIASKAASEDAKNVYAKENAVYLRELVQEIGPVDIGPGRIIEDESLRNADNIVAVRQHPRFAWIQEKMLRAVRAQIAHSETHGGHRRGDGA